jgi:hypothetical protein
MPLISDFRCDRCGFVLPTGWGGADYVLDEAGTRIVCPHPAEQAKAIQVISRSIPDFAEQLRRTRARFYRQRLQLQTWLARVQRRAPPVDPWTILRERTGFNADAVCRRCLEQFELDTERDPRICPACGDPDVKTVSELVDRSCPECILGVIRCIRTGAEC